MNGVTSGNCTELERAWDQLSDRLEDEDAGNDEVRDAAIRMCAALNALMPDGKVAGAFGHISALQVAAPDMLKALLEVAKDGNEISISTRRIVREAIDKAGHHPE